MARFLAGTSGWVYPHWRGAFYPEELDEREWFAYYAERFDTVEINNTFYRLPPRSTFEGWRRKAPPGFLFSVKASRYLTHVKKLKDPEKGVERFYESLGGMGDLCAAVLFQLPPRWRANPGRLEEFLDALPGGYRTVLEFRDRSWLDEKVYDVLGRHGAALCFADSPFYPAPRVKTADFSFYRMHGGHGNGKPRYDGDELKELALEVRGELAQGRDCFVYFNNDYRAYAVENALELKGLLEGREGVTDA
jgi:uncharacterized protein YecE (DUF72 family)